MFDIFTEPSLRFLRYALISGLLSSLAFGIVGSFVVARKISYIAGSIAHSVLAGIGFSLYAQYHFDWNWFHPMLGATIAALLSALLIGFVTLRARQNEDTVIGAVWAIGMALGLILIALTPGYIDPMSYLFGNILMMSSRDLWRIALLDGVIVSGIILLYNKLQAVCFDDEFVKVRGLNADGLYILLLLITALTIVLMVHVVGIVLVIALLTLPAAVASLFAKRLWQMMSLAVLFSMIFTTGGIAASYSMDLPSGPVIILLAGTVYLAGTTIKSMKM
ncbi:metal ABC transporter permease [Calditrichota bacterium]